MKVLFLDAAREEFKEAIAYYEGSRPGLGREFRATVRDAIERIHRHPTAWHPLSERTRRCLTHKFPYGVIYQLREKEILIVAVAHLHREPTYWEHRLPNQ